MSTEISFYVLIVLLVSTNLFWANTYLKLANRFMSRDYGSFVQATHKPTKPTLVVEDLRDPLAEENAFKANSMIGPMS